MSATGVDTVLSRRTELPPAIGRLAAVLTATLAAGLVMYGWWAAFAWLLLLACAGAPKLMAMIGLMVLAYAVAIGLGVVAIALLVWGLFAAPLFTLPLAFMVLALVDRR